MKRFRSLWRHISNAYVSALGRKGPLQIDESETVCRFIFDKKKFNKTCAKAKPSAFTPARDLKTSVFRSGKLSDSKLRQVRQIVSRKRDKPCLATTYLKVSDIRTTFLDDANIDGAKLNIEPNEKDHKWHADIIDWPSAKQDQILLSQKLARKSFGLKIH